MRYSALEYTNFLVMPYESIFSRTFKQLVLEEEDFKKFLSKFHDKLDDFEYENFVKDG